MDKFEIVPYDPQHGEDMIAYGLNDKLMDHDATFKDNRIDFKTPALSYTLLCNGECYLQWWHYSFMEWKCSRLGYIEQKNI